MTLNANDKLTALEAIRRMGQPWPGRIIECITQNNEMMMDMPAIECNGSNGTDHTIVRRVALEGATSRRYYEGTKSGASQTDVVHEPTGMWQAISKIDEDLATHTGNVSQLRKSESIAFMNKMGIDQARDFIYGDRKASGGREIDGFYTRYNAVDNKNVFAAPRSPGANPKLTSCYLMALGERHTHLIYPKGIGTVGARAQFKDPELTGDGKGGEYLAYVGIFKAQFGIAVEDPRSVIRIANIDPAEFLKDNDGPDEFVLFLTQRMRRMPHGAGTYVIYCNYAVQDIMDKATNFKNNVNYSVEDLWGRPINMIRNARIRTMEAIREDEDEAPPIRMADAPKPNQKDPKDQNDPKDPKDQKDSKKEAA